MDLSYDRIQNEYVHICCHDIGNNGVDKSDLNVSDNLCVSTVISKTVKRKNSVEDCVNQTLLSYRNKNQWLQKGKENEWLTIQIGKLGCRACSEVRCLSIHTMQKMTSRECKEFIATMFEDNEK